MSSKREERLRKARLKKKASKATGMANPGGATRYALKQAGEVQRLYRVEGGLLLSQEYLRVLEMPGPHVVEQYEKDPENGRWLRVA
jgi:hypothetical protein